MKAGMNRQTLTDGTGRWFDLDKVVHRFAEKTHFDGHNRIVNVTGSPWEHEGLYYTAGKKWILHHWSQWQGAEPSWEEITKEEAASWLSRNGDDPPAEIESEFAALEVA